MAEELSQEQLREKVSKMSPEELTEFQKQQCPFCKIVSGEYPSTKVYEDKEVLAILDINPIRPGHILVLPKQHIPFLPLVPEKLQRHMYKIVQSLSKCTLQTLGAQGTNIFIASGQIAGQLGQHTTIYIIPRNEDDGITQFALPKNPAKASELVEMKKLFAHNLPIMLREQLKRYPVPGKEPPIVADEEILRLIEQQPQLKELLINKPDELKNAIEQNEQLKTLFEGKDIDILRQKLLEQKKNISDLDSVAALFDADDKADADDTTAAQSEDRGNKSTRQSDQSLNLDDVSALLSGRDSTKNAPAANMDNDHHTTEDDDFHESNSDHDEKDNDSKNYKDESKNNEEDESENTEDDSSKNNEEDESENTEDDSSKSNEEDESENTEDDSSENEKKIGDTSNESKTDARKSKRNTGQKIHKKNANLDDIADLFT